MKDLKMNNIELKQKVYDGLFDKGVEISEKVKSRIELEWETFDNNNQLDYITFYYDLVSFAKDNDIKIGSGRGVSCCSLVLYALDITKINPLNYGLIFERIPKRLDVDFDVEPMRREEIVQYLKQKYGEENVLRSVAYDVHKKPHPHACKWIIKKDGDALPVSEVDGELVIICEDDAVNSTQLFNVDLLTLNVLSDIKDTVALIKERYTEDVVFDADKCEDEKTFSLINALDTEDVFQLSFESSKELIKKYPIKSLNDISFIIAICRPPYIGETEILEKSPAELSEFLTETNGVLVYQEQVIEILHKLCDIDFGEAERVRKLLVTRNLDDAVEFEKIFTEKVSVKYGSEIANKIWEYLWDNSSYCFLKAHSLSYAFTAYQSADLKANYRKEFRAIFTKRRKEFARRVTM